jgi:predicted RNA binding protein YcfA (HicA-like mRNA interferase family)
MTSKELLKKLLVDGWVIDRIKGSHHVIKKGNMTEIIPMHNKDIATGLLNKILKRTGLK